MSSSIPQLPPGGPSHDLLLLGPLAKWAVLSGAAGSAASGLPSSAMPTLPPNNLGSFYPQHSPPKSVVHLLTC